MIKRSEVIARLLVPLALLPGLSGCVILSSAEQIESTVSPLDPNQPKISFDAARKNDPQSSIGADGHPRIIEANGGVYQNEKLEQLLALVAGRLVTSSNDPERAYSITVLDSPSINAFALPGGYLYVTRGLLALANDAAEVAAVLAHEMAHVSSNHGIERNREAQATDIAERVLSQVVTNPIAGEVVKASTEQKLTAFSQRQELQADAVGIKLLGKAGYDAFAASRFLRSMDRFSRWSAASSASGADDMNSSHPSTPQRVELAERHARQIGPAGTGETNRDRYLQGIDGIEFGNTGNDGLVRENGFYHKRLGIAFAVPDGFDITNRDDAVIAAGPDQTALRFDAVATDGQSSQVIDYLRSGWVNGLEDQSVVRRTINGLEAASGQAQAGDWKFSITVVRFNKRYYRFILAAPRQGGDVEGLGKTIADSFHAMSKIESASLKPLRVRLARVGSGDTIATLSGKMSGVSRKVDLFRALNGLGEGDRPVPGSKVKIVSQ